MNVDKPYQRLLSRWGSFTGPSRGASPDAITALEQRYDFVLPPDFRDYLLFAAPRVDEGMDDEFIDWWPLSRIKNIPDEYEHPVAEWLQPDASGYLFFADLLIWCWAWAICCRGDNYGKIVIIGVERERFVADSFGAFVDLYLSDVQALASDSTP